MYVTSAYSDADKQLALVCSYTDNVVVDALTGKLYTRWGNDEAAYTAPTYFNANAADLVGDHLLADQILALYNIDFISLDADFDPDAAISKDEFAQLLRNLNYSAYRTFTNGDAYESDDSMTTEDAIIAIIDALGYGDIAQLTDIFNPNAVPAGVASSAAGYYAIANGLNLLANLSPSAAVMTKAEACCLLYNFIVFSNQ